MGPSCSWPGKWHRAQAEEGVAGAWRGRGRGAAGSGGRGAALGAGEQGGRAGPGQWHGAHPREARGPVDLSERDALPAPFPENCPEVKVCCQFSCGPAASPRDSRSPDAHPTCLLVPGGGGGLGGGQRRLSQLLDRSGQVLPGPALSLGVMERSSPSSRVT